jgi:hypothetical protein
MFDSSAEDALWFHKKEIAMAPAGEHCQWVTMMRQWMVQFDDNRTAEHVGKPATELEALAAVSGTPIDSPTRHGRA